MINELHLQGTDLLIYAMLSSRVKDKDSDSGLSTIKYFASILGISKNTVKDSLARLCARGLVSEQTRLTESLNHYKEYTIVRAPIADFKEQERLYRAQRDKELLNGMSSLCDQITEVATRAIKVLSPDLQEDSEVDEDDEDDDVFILPTP